MLNPDPEKYAALPEAFNALGHKRCGKKWTGAELAARSLPPPKVTFRALDDAKIARARAYQELEHERRTKVEKAKKAAAGVSSGVSITRRRRRRPLTPEALEQEQLVEIARYAQLDPEIVTAASNQNAYRREYRARSRRDKTENELRKLLHGKHVPATLLNNYDGKLVDIPPAHWLSEKFTVDFTSGHAEWADLEGVQRTTYQGIILIDRRDFDRMVIGPQQLTAIAESKCRQWARGLPNNPVWRKPDFITEAQANFTGLSKLGAMRVWDAEVPSNWKLAGRKS